MALKFGRTAGITSRIDPNGKIMYTEEELDAYNTAVGAEQERKSAYDASMSQFNRDNDAYYGKSTVDAKAAEAGAALLNKSNMKIGGANVTGTAAKGQSQAQSDLELQAKVNKGLYVSINDPSISDKTRELMQGANRGVDLSNAYVRTGTDATDYNKMYGYNYNPVQARKDVLSGKISSDENVGHMVKDEYGFISMGKKPVKPGPYVPANLGKKIDPKDVDWKQNKMEPLKPTKVDPIKLGKLKPAKEEEVPTWSAPVMDRRKGARSVGQTRIKPTGESGVKNAHRKTISDKILPQRIKYNTEKRQSAAYFSGQTSFGDDITGKNESELRDFKKETKGYLKHVRKQDGMSHQDVKDVRGDLGTIRKAIRYAKKADLGVSSVTGLTMEGDQSTLRYFTPERTKLAMNGDGKKTREDGAMAGYRDVQKYNETKVKQQQYGSYLDKLYRAQEDNATNSNTVTNQQAKLDAAAANASPTSFYTTRGQMKDKFKTDNPTATPRQIRQGVRLESATNKKMLQEQAKRMKETGMLP
jgi:hypothetical protein